MLGACSGDPDKARDPASSPTEIENGSGKSTTPSGDRTQNKPRAGTAGSAGTKPSPTGTGGRDSEPDTADAGVDSAGMGGAAGEAGEPPPPCDLNGNCSSDGDGATVTCGVVPWNECEFSGFVGATADVHWGQAKVIGTACCGACECVPVEVYFDGAQCWQGIPQCGNNQFVVPHATTTPNPSFTPPTDIWGTFHMGSGGYGGSAGSAAEAAGTGGVAGGAGGAGALEQGGMAQAGAAPITPQGGAP